MWIKNFLLYFLAVLLYNGSYLLNKGKPQSRKEIKMAKAKKKIITAEEEIVTEQIFYQCHCGSKRVNKFLKRPKDRPGVNVGDMVCIACGHLFRAR